ncbi:PaaI family thioesterase [Arthrobacter ramosus]|nr:PaaI family thioesterase [Arthrobacter ramosus]
MAVKAAGLSGLDYVQGLADGSVPPPPMAVAMAMTVTAVEPGRVTFRCDPEEVHYNPLGVIHGGLVCTLLDTAIGCAAHTTLPAGVSYTSIEISVSYLRPVLPELGPLTAVGTVRKSGRRVVFAAGDVLDKNGKLVATATSSLLVTTP